MIDQKASSIRKTGLRWLWLTALVLILDYVSKWAAVHFLTYHQAKMIFPGFNLFLAYNKGAAFSFLGAASGWQVWLFVGIAIVFSVIILRMLYQVPSETRTLFSLALALILAGALGNLIDRLAYGYVVDFIQVYYRNSYFPTFNIADSAITVGAVLLVIDILRSNKKTTL